MPVLRHALTGLSCVHRHLQTRDHGGGPRHEADIINDIHGFSLPGAIETVAAFPGAGLCVMRTCKALPTTMQERPHYQDVLAEVCHFRGSRVDSYAAERRR